MNGPTRSVVFLVGAALLGLALLLATSRLPAFGHYRGPYGDRINAQVMAQRRTTNAVSAVTFDYRGLDTMGEEFILFGSVLGVVLLLRGRGSADQEEPEAEDAVESDALRVLGALMVGVALLVGIWLVAFGYVTPGGGFQGGVAIAGAVLLVYISSSYRAWKRMSNIEVLDPVEGTGVGGYVVVGVAALASSLPFLHNLLGGGTTGTLLSGGSIPFLNWATAIEVGAANIVLCSEFLEQYVAPIARRRSR